MADCRDVQFACGHPLSEPNPQCGAEYPEGEGHPAEAEVAVEASPGATFQPEVPTVVQNA